MVEFKPLLHLNLGQKFKLLCYNSEGISSTTGKLMIFEWSKNGLILNANSNSRYRIDIFDDESHFTIDQLTKEDSGNYSCSARNDAGFSRQSTLLVVQCGCHFDCFSICGANCMLSFDLLN